MNHINIFEICAVLSGSFVSILCHRSVENYIYD
jgi:hypothetical protein